MTENTNVVTFSFAPVSPRSNAPAGKVASPGLLKFYMDLCVQKRREPVDNIADLDQSIVQGLVDELKAYYPPSEKQLTLIREKCQLLADAGQPQTIDFDSLTGGFNGTASTIIADLFEKEKLYVVLPPTTNQLQFLCSMYLCPDVDFESEGIIRRVDVDDTNWRYLTPDEFVAIISASMSKIDASAFINRYRGSFNEWKTTRIRPGQLNHIRTLLERTGSVVDEITLMMFSQDEAAKYIETLLNEAKKPPMPVKGETVHPEPCNCTDPKESTAKEEQIITDMVYRLMAESGFEPTNLDEILSKPEALKDYIVYLTQECFIEPEELVQMMEDSSILHDLFVDDLR